MSEDLVVSIFDENNDIEEDNVLMGKVSVDSIADDLVGWDNKIQIYILILGLCAHGKGEERGLIFFLKTSRFHAIYEAVSDHIKVFSVLRRKYQLEFGVTITLKTLHTYDYEWFTELSLFI